LRGQPIPIGIVSADAEQCYDHIAHVFAFLVFQAFGVFITTVIVMFSSIQHMKFYLRTGLGESVGFMMAVIGSIIQGLCQGNSAAPAGWSLIAALFLSRFTRVLDMVLILSRQSHDNNMTQQECYMLMTLIFLP
jgi:hypothetical protein